MIQKTYKYRYDDRSETYKLAICSCQASNKNKATNELSKVGLKPDITLSEAIGLNIFRVVSNQTHVKIQINNTQYISVVSNTYHHIVGFTPENLTKDLDFSKITEILVTILYNE